MLHETIHPFTKSLQTFLKRQDRTLKHYFAPMEGITDHIFRTIHHRYFPGMDKYFTPFFSPTADGRFPPRDRRDFLPEANAGVPVVPQLLTRHAADFLWAARALGGMGYEEVNLNLGCPSGTVVAKGKGSGMLTDLAALETFFDEVFAKTSVAVSVKTRLGRYDPGEFPKLLELFNRYPIAELTVHCRVRDDFYKKPAQPEVFALALKESRNPVCYNGDLVTAEKYRAFAVRFPETPAVMLGRGLVADPALVRRLQGGGGVEKGELRAYLGELFEAYSSAFGSPKSALGRMKEHWFYLICLFEGGEKFDRELKKAADPVAYQTLVERIFAELPLRDGGAAPAW